MKNNRRVHFFFILLNQKVVKNSDLLEMMTDSVKNRLRNSYRNMDMSYDNLQLRKLRERASKGSIVHALFYLDLVFFLPELPQMSLDRLIFKSDRSSFNLNTISETVKGFLRNAIPTYLNNLRTSISTVEKQKSILMRMQRDLFLYEKWIQKNE